jgi:Tfp pilus assembly protein PilZ
VVVAGATIGGMTLKEHIHQLVDSLADDDDRLQAAEQVLELDPNGAGVKAKKVGRLSFSGIGTDDATDVSERFEEYLGRAIDARHPRS